MEEFEVTVVGKTEMGLWLEFESVFGSMFIPDSQIGADSPIYIETGLGESGTIIITRWIAEKKGLV